MDIAALSSCDAVRLIELLKTGGLGSKRITTLEFFNSALKP